MAAARLVFLNQLQLGAKINIFSFDRRLYNAGESRLTFSQSRSLNCHEIFSNSGDNGFFIARYKGPNTALRCSYWFYDKQLSDENTLAEARKRLIGHEIRGTDIAACDIF